MCHNLYFLHYTQQKLYLIFVLGWLIWIGHTISVYNTAAMKCETFLTIGKDMGRIQRETLVSHLSGKKKNPTHQCLVRGKSIFFFLNIINI